MSVKSCYTVRCSDIHIAILDCCDYYNRGMIITRINVPQQYRKMGHGAALLKQCLYDADESNTILFLEVLASGEMGRDELIEWYKRYGFRDIGGIMRRIPRRSL